MIYAELGSWISGRLLLGLLLVNVLLWNRLLLIYLLPRNFVLWKRGLRLLSCLDIAAMRLSCETTKTRCAIGDAMFVKKVSYRILKSAKPPLERCQYLQLSSKVTCCLYRGGADRVKRTEDAQSDHEKDPVKGCESSSGLRSLDR
jgi:hypothetical protein